MDTPWRPAPSGAIFLGHAIPSPKRTLAREVCVHVLDLQRGDQLVRLRVAGKLDDQLIGSGVVHRVAIGFVANFKHGQHLAGNECPGSSVPPDMRSVGMA